MRTLHRPRSANRADAPLRRLPARRPRPAGAALLLWILVPAAALAHTPERIPEDFAALLGRDRAAGRLDATAAAFYTLYAVRDRDRLPEEYRRAAERSARICATPALVHLRQVAAKLTPEQRRELALLEVRPPSAGSIASALIPARVHWQDSTQIAEAEACLAILEHCWQVEVGTMGFAAPPIDQGAGGSNDFDFYLDGAMAPGNGFSEGEFENMGTWWYDLSSFIVIGAGAPEPLRRALIAHEFNHSCQWAMDAAEDDAFYENTASFVEDLVYDEVNDNYNVLPWFQDFPHRSLDYYGEVYQYGAFLWEAFLAERYGDGGAALIRDLWNASRQASHQNEPDYFDVIGDILPPGTDHDLDDFYVGFAQWRFFTGPWHDAHHYEEAYPTGVRIDQTFANGLVPIGVIVPSAGPMEYGAIYHLFLPGAAPAPGDLRISLSAPAHKHWSISLLGVRPDGGPPALVEARAVNGAATCTMPQREQYAAIALVTANLGDGQHDPDQDEWSGTLFTFTASLLPPGASVAATGGTATARLWLEGPNPVASGTALRSEGLEGSRIRVWDLAGRCRRTLPLPPGGRSLRWDGRDDSGRRLPAGTYWLSDDARSVRPVRVTIAR